MPKIAWFALIIAIAILIGGGLAYLFVTSHSNAEYYDRSDELTEELETAEARMTIFLVVLIFFSPVISLGTMAAYALWPKSTQSVIKQILG